MTSGRAPSDPDGAPRAAHHDPRVLALVLAGGTAGTALRAGVGSAAGGATIGTTIAINLTGAFLLGVLLAALGRRGPDVGTRRALRVALGTGLLGGFTTYSTMATDAAGLILGGSVAAAAGVLAATVLGGALTAALGLLAGGRLP